MEEDEGLFLTNSHSKNDPFSCKILIIPEQRVTQDQLSVCNRRVRSVIGADLVQTTSWFVGTARAGVTGFRTGMGTEEGTGTEGQAPR